MWSALSSRAISGPGKKDDDDDDAGETAMKGEMQDCSIFHPPSQALSEIGFLGTLSPALYWTNDTLQNAQTVDTWIRPGTEAMSATTDPHHVL